MYDIYRIYTYRYMICTCVYYINRRQLANAEAGMGITEAILSIWTDVA